MKWSKKINRSTNLINRMSQRRTQTHLCSTIQRLGCHQVCLQPSQIFRESPCLHSELEGSPKLQRFRLKQAVMPRAFKGWFEITRRIMFPTEVKNLPLFDNSLFGVLSVPSLRAVKKYQNGMEQNNSPCSIITMSQTHHCLRFRRSECHQVRRCWL